MGLERNWRRHWPAHLTPRDVQAELLDRLEDSWGDYDAHVISAPTGLGKSAISATLLNTHRDSNYLAPNNLLVDQFSAAHPEIPVLRRLDSYFCDYWRRPCVITRAKLRSYCPRTNECQG